MTTTDWTTDTKGAGQYAEVNGINLYYETIGDGLEPGEDDRWLDEVVHAARARQSELGPRVTRVHERVARLLTGSDELRRFWGIQK